MMEANQNAAMTLEDRDCPLRNIKNTADKHVTHLSSHPVVMYPHASVDVSWRPAGVEPVPGETVPKTDVMTAAPPLPGLLHGAQLIW